MHLSKRSFVHGLRASAVLLAASVGITIAAACAGLTSTERDALSVGYDIACGAATLIPGVGPAIFAACKDEEPRVDAAMNDAVIKQDAGTSAPVGTATAAVVRGAAVEIKPIMGDTPVTFCARYKMAPLFHRKSGAHKHRHIACTEPQNVPHAQAYLDAHP